MKSRAFRRTRVAAAVGAALLSLSAGHAFGAAFALQEQNASGLSHAYAGGAAAAEDVSTIFYNPAGLVRLQTMQVVAAGNIICPSVKFHDNGSQPAAFQTLGGTGGDASSCAAVPNMYLGVPFTDKWSFGLGVGVPFGLETEYDSNWLLVRVDAREPSFREPLERDARLLAERVGARGEVVLLGSIASPKYVEPLLAVLGERLLFPPDFVGRGDMSRGGLLLRAVRAGVELLYAPVLGATLHGKRPPRLGAPGLPRR